MWSTRISGFNGPPIVSSCHFSLLSKRLEVMDVCDCADWRTRLILGVIGAGHTGVTHVLVVVSL